MFYGEFKVSSILLVIIMVHPDVITKGTAFKNVKPGDFQFNVGKLFTNKHKFVIRAHMFQ